MTNWNNPQLSSTYTNFVTEVKDRDVDLATQFADTSGLSNIATNTIRWDTSANRWKKWDGSAWGELASEYALTTLSTTGTAEFGGNVTITGTLDATSTVSGTAFIPDGSTVPSNGMYLPSTNTLGFATDGTAKIHVTSDGDVGINDSTPSAKLDVGGGIKATGTNGYTFNDNDTDGGMFSPANNRLEFRTNNSPRLSINGTNVGIGDTTPDELFHVHNASANATSIKISNTEGNVFIRANADEARYDADGHSFRNESGSTIARIDTANTRLGIGTASPGNTLHVNGTARITGDSQFDGDVTVTGTLDATTSLATDLALTGTNAVVIQSSNNNSTVIGNGTSGQFLRTNGTESAPSWQTIGGTIPVGGIILWSGAKSAIPTNWALCDGTNSTPDLRNRFVVGASSDGSDSTYPNLSVDATGGHENAVVVTHNHGTTGSGGSHSHGVDDDGHTHGYIDQYNDGNGGYRWWKGGDNDCNDRIIQTQSQTTGISIESGGSHTHSVGNAGESGTNKNLPPFYALCYIMRTA